MFIKSIRILAMILVLFCYLNYYFTSVLIKHCIDWVIKKQYSEASYQPWLLSSVLINYRQWMDPFVCVYFISTFDPLILSLHLGLWRSHCWVGYFGWGIIQGQHSYHATPERQSHSVDFRCAGWCSYSHLTSHTRTDANMYTHIHILI